MQKQGADWLPVLLQPQKLLFLGFKFLGGDDAVVHEPFVFPDGLGVPDLCILGRVILDHGRRLRWKLAVLASAAGTGRNIGRMDPAAGASPAAGSQDLLIMRIIRRGRIPPGGRMGAIIGPIEAGVAFGNVLLCLSVLRHMLTVGGAAVNIL